MTKQNKLIVGAVVVLGAYYLYTKNKAKKEVSDLKAGADVTTPTMVNSVPEKVLDLPQTGGIKLAQEQDYIKGKGALVTELSFDGKKSKSLFSTTF